MKRVLLICVSSQSIITFRKELIKTFKDRGYSVAVIAFDSEYEKEVTELGVDFYSVKDRNRSVNPVSILSLKKRYKAIIQQVKPDIIFTFMLKPNIFGVLAAKSAGVEKIFSMVEGAGDVFINNTFKWKLVRAFVCFLYKISLRHSEKVFFLNTDDKTEFISRRLVREEQCELIHGVGVNLEHFAEKPIKNHKTFLMVARMLKTKGTLEYCECARRVRQKNPDAIFNYIGAEGNVTIADIKEYISDGSINYLGTTKDVRPYLENSTFFVLPSCREGCPMSVMEAESVGRGVITTCNVGCREMVCEGYNGFLVADHDVDSLVEKCLYVIEHPNEAEQLCHNSRKFAEKNFDSRVINEKIISTVEKL